MPAYPCAVCRRGLPSITNSGGPGVLRPRGIPVGEWQTARGMGLCRPCPSRAARRRIRWRSGPMWQGPGPAARPPCHCATGRRGGMTPAVDCCGACWPLAPSRRPSLDPPPSAGGGAHQPLTPLCPPSPSPQAYPHRPTHPSFQWEGRANAAPQGMHWKGGMYPPPGRPAYARPLSPSRQVPASLACVTDSNRPPTALATSSNRLPNRLWGCLQDPFPYNASLPGRGRGGHTLSTAQEKTPWYRPSRKASWQICAFRQLRTKFMTGRDLCGGGSAPAGEGVVHERLRGGERGGGGRGSHGLCVLPSPARLGLCVRLSGQTADDPRTAAEAKGPQRRPQRRLRRRLEGVAKAVGGGYCRLQVPLKVVVGVRGTVAGRRLGGLEGEGGGGGSNASLVCGGTGGHTGSHLRDVPRPTSVMAGAVLHVPFGLCAAVQGLVCAPVLRAPGAGGRGSRH